MAATLWFVEYYRERSGEPVNLTMGCRSLAACRHRGRVVAKLNGYCGFWISSKPEGSTAMPQKLEYHGVTYSPRGVAVWHKPVRLVKTEVKPYDGIEGLSTIVETWEEVE